MTNEEAPELVDVKMDSAPLKRHAENGEEKGINLVTIVECEVVIST